MTNKVNLQDAFLDNYKENQQELTVFLTNGFQMKGTVLDYDKYVILLKVGDKQNLIYKHAISTFVE
ncbi:RNA chaperone Hfq [Macrococcus armenti]|uniref:RNA chaperone Hfq n=1 Tax=Macrococcus armenti TaxID=2875764 RepID=UPI001CCCC389|nr:RNA chaperone Hfq [Macrococcus armenti]UBH09607.1 RNA chaperone Hfq [Macrococcus armenti]UBH11882.1 RNA chaperone Hfq [Macrococcus armenti]UBH16358.1 RNA chaperone Hfq [Macrococcus armenti]UBH18714.1 RNA chaperone Hfq [Macrococcus armenti]UBH20986.1 RNA chaperone Hfq [Macrococcus armenti]